MGCRLRHFSWLNLKFLKEAGQALTISFLAKAGSSETDIREW
jgi:hypothetical protein